MLSSSPNQQPAGTVTFLFTDIEGSTRLWEKYPESMALALARHDDELRRTIEGAGGYINKTVGDAFCAAFASAEGALEAGYRIQRLLEKEDPILVHDPQGRQVGRIRVRVSLHTGVAQARDNDYFGTAVNRVARILSLGHGGQTLLSLATREMLLEAPLPEGVTLRDLGSRRLKDLSRPEQVFQLVHPDLPDNFPDLRSLDTLPNNLPHHLNSFIGREKEMETLKRRLGKGADRLVTLRGPGGAGKTRLATQTAADLLDEYNGGVWLVELAPLTDPTLVPQAIANVLSIREEAGRPLLSTLAEQIREKALLLILDNCEHLIDACAQTAETLLTNCPNLRILCTSRESLGIAGEAILAVPSLQIPEMRAARRILSVDELTRYESVQLFAERAVVSSPTFALTERNALPVAQICRRLDGIPLAIELAAARTRVLSPEQIAQRLDDRFRLLTGGSRTALPRQQTLRALVDWSYDLLTESERTLLRRLAIFAGGWTLEAAERVGSDEQIDEFEVLDLLSLLADKSLVVVEGDDTKVDGPPRRYRLYETIRQYGLDRLRDDAEEGERLRRAHRDYFLTLAEEADPHLQGPERTAYLDLLDTEQDNFRAILGGCLDPSSGQEGSEAALRLAAALREFWISRGALSEGRAALEEALRCSEASGDTAAARHRIRALWSAASIAGLQGDVGRARELSEQCRELSRTFGDAEGMARSLNTLANDAYARCEYDEARTLLEQAREAAKAAGNDLIRIGILQLSGMVAYASEDHVAARAYLEEALAAARRIGSRGDVAYCYLVLGDLACAEGDFEEAVRLDEQAIDILAATQDDYSLAIARECLAFALWNRGAAHHERAAQEYCESLILSQRIDDRMNIAKCLAGLGGLTLAAGDAERAARLFGAVESLCAAMETPLPPLEQASFERDAAAARHSLGDAAFERLRDAGRTLPLEDAVSLALSNALQ